MTEENRSLTRSILFSLLVVGVVAAGMGTVTWAYFSDTDTADANTIEGGTMDLSINGSDSLTGEFSVTSGTPGETTEQRFELRNTGGVAADHVEVGFSTTGNDPGAEPTDTDLNVELNASETASLVRVTKLEYQNDSGVVLTDLLGSVSDTNGNGIVDVEEATAQAPFDDLAAPLTNQGNSTYLVVEVAIANDDSAAFVKEGNTAGNLTGYDEDVMADGIDLAVQVTLNQDPSQ